ncbi:MULTISPECIES: helix-turn-helix domain-containing protein [Pseudoalteromonas]|uniref:helix-turn-helix domain-containing protein n=1 Tax=Pseudoalteromonas TaxID=53246 RepID=UPI001582A978|nr:MULTISPECIES: helix-turn-helix domain-containing protein [Pseudoalteromonas]MDI4653089.1 helix-turn-helix domain-containing protein [Pseudoalteromonas shioyasakiensis]NUJ39207.1 helix-turn-helix domain-containing protein [Pseudoalteromonas sp. 0303]
MEVSVSSAKQLGKLISAVRKSQGLDQRTIGEFSGNSINTVGDFEKGSGSLSVNRLFGLMDSLGIEMKIDFVLPPIDTSARKKLIKRVNEMIEG